jgi:hypothetical protein
MHFIHIKTAFHIRRANTLAIVSTVRRLHSATGNEGLGTIAPSQAKPLNVSVQTVHQADFTDSFLEKLYTLASESVQEDFKHFCDHCNTNSICHVFSVSPHDAPSMECDISAANLAGFQFWRIQATCEVEHTSLIWGGKLRFRHQFRGRGLNVLANVMAYKHFERIQPGNLFVRVGLVNVFGYHSLAVGLQTISIFPFNGTSFASGKMRRAVVPEISRFCQDNAFAFEPATGTVDVGQTFPQEVLSRMEETAFLQRPVLQSFLDVNRQWHDRDIFVAWEWDSTNLASMQQVAEKRMQHTSTSVSVF